VLLYDRRAHGESGGDQRTLGWQDVGDVDAALTFLRTQTEVDPARIGIWGFSLGGQVALRAAAEMEGIAAVLAEEPGFVTIQDLPTRTSLFEQLDTFTWWIGLKVLAWRSGVSAPPGVTEVIDSIAPRPIFFISTNTDMGHRIVNHYYDLAGEPKTLWQIPETTHGGGLSTRPDEFEERVVSFFNEALLAD